jgi:hypothetical protein
VTTSATPAIRSLIKRVSARAAAVLLAAGVVLWHPDLRADPTTLLVQAGDAPNSGNPPPVSIESVPAESIPEGVFLVQVTSQRNDADARAAYAVLQAKFPAVFGSRALIVKKSERGSRGIYYRGCVGPFDTVDAASEFCGSLKQAGGMCLVVKN